MLDDFFPLYSDICSATKKSFFAKIRLYFRCYGFKGVFKTIFNKNSIMISDLIEFANIVEFSSHILSEYDFDKFNIRYIQGTAIYTIDTKGDGIRIVVKAMKGTPCKADVTVTIKEDSKTSFSFDQSYTDTIYNRLETGRFTDDILNKSLIPSLKFAIEAYSKVLLSELEDKLKC